MASCRAVAPWGLGVRSRLIAAQRPAPCAQAAARLARPSPSRLFQRAAVPHAVGLAPPSPGRRAPLCVAAKASGKEEKDKKKKEKKKDKAAPALQAKALLIDCDGVLAETERDGHRVCFNGAFKEKGLPSVWDVDTYGELLKIGGGKERMRKYFEQHEADLPPEMRGEGEAQKHALGELIKQLHDIKTKLFLGWLASGDMEARAGMRRLITDALDKGVKVAICSTSHADAVKAVLTVVVGKRAEEVPVFAGDCVKNKKPSPDIYLLAAQELGVAPADCVVIEDSRIGMLAGKAALMKVIVTPSSYTRDEDFTEADAVLDGIAEAGLVQGERRKKKKKESGSDSDSGSDST